MSNEQAYLTDVYFDDITVTFTPTPVIQQEDYYPFGLKFNSYSRENSVPNTLKLFQDQEHIDDLGLNWDAFKWRNHQPDIGRFFNIDPLSEKYAYNSPYAFSENKVVAHRELEGLEAVEAIKFEVGGKVSKQSQSIKVSGFTPVDLSGKHEGDKFGGDEEQEKSQLPREVENAKPLTGVEPEAVESFAKGMEGMHKSMASESLNKKEGTRQANQQKAAFAKQQVMKSFDKMIQKAMASYKPPSIRSTSNSQKQSGDGKQQGNGNNQQNKGSQQQQDKDKKTTTQ